MSPISMTGPLLLFFLIIWLIVVYAFSFSCVSLAAIGRCTPIMVIGTVAFILMYMVPSSIGSMSSIYCTQLFLIAIATPSVYSGCCVLFLCSFYSSSFFGFFACQSSLCVYVFCVL